MTMAICDLCGGQCRAIEIEQLLSNYQVPGVTDICPACSRWATKTKHDMLGNIAADMRAAIARRKGTPVRTWWSRLFGCPHSPGPTPPPPRPPA